MKIAIDLSRYNYLTDAQWDAIAKVADGVIVRLSFGVTEDIAAGDHLSNARKRGLAAAGYHWSDPTWDMARQVTVATAAINKHKVAGWFSDAEQYWSDWAAYMAGDYAQAYATRFPAATLDGFFKKIQTLVQAQMTIPVGNYSADWFIGMYSPQMGLWIYDANYWYAAYLRYTDPIWWTEYLKNKKISTAMIHDITLHAPIYRGLGRQFESYMPGAVDIPEHLDWSVFTDAGFLRMFGAPGKPDDPIYEEPEANFQSYMVTETVFVHDVPDGRHIGYRWAKDIVLGIDQSMGWVLVDGKGSEGPTAKGWIPRVYLAPIGNMYTVNTAALWIRDIPMGTKISYLLFGAVVQVDKIANDWAHILANGSKPAGWVSMKYLKGM